MSENIYEAPSSNVNRQGGQAVTLSAKEILFSFKGRIPRKTYWMYFLGMIISVFLIIFLISLIGVNESVVAVITLVLYIPCIWASLAIQVKRWHDRNKSAWWVLISFVPIIGPIWAFIENGCLAGDEGENNFGPPTL